MSGTLTVRLDERTKDELERLVADGVGPTRNAVVREAIHHITRVHLERRLRDNSQIIMNDPDEQRRLRELADEMDDLRAW